MVSEISGNLWIGADSWNHSGMGSHHSDCQRQQFQFEQHRLLGPPRPRYARGWKRRSLSCREPGPFRPVGHHEGAIDHWYRGMFILKSYLISYDTNQVPSLMRSTRKTCPSSRTSISSISTKILLSAALPIRTSGDTTLTGLSTRITQPSTGLARLLR